MSQSTPHFRHHLFFCTNRRDDGRECCAEKGGEELRDYCKAQVKNRGLAGSGRVRVNQAGCLDRCEHGPVAVVYPEGVWYRCASREDVDAIIDGHLVHGQPVERLRVC